MRTGSKNIVCNAWTDEARAASIAARAAHGTNAEKADDYHSHRAAEKYHYDQSVRLEKAGRSISAAAHLAASKSHDKAGSAHMGTVRDPSRGVAGSSTPTDSGASKRARNASIKAHKVQDDKEAEIQKYTK